MGEKSREKKERKEIGDSPSVGKSTSSQNSFLWWIIFIGTCLISVIPFIIGLKYFFPFVGPKSLYFMGIAEIIFAAWLILAFSTPKYRPKMNAVLLSLVLFLVVFAISSFLGVDFSRSFWSKYERMTGLLMQLHLFAFFLVVSSTFKRKEDWLKIFGVFALAGTIMSLVSLAPKIGWNILGTIESSSRGGATLGNSSFLGTYLLFNFFLSLYLFFNTKKYFKIISGIGVAIIFISLLFSTAQAALLSTLIGLALLFLLLFIFANKGIFRKLGITVAIILMIGVLVGAFFALKPEGRAYYLSFIQDHVGQTFGGRFIVWEGAWQSFLEKPFFGWGPENFEITFTRYFNSCMLGDKCGGDIWYDRAHNIIFDTLATTGILGIVSYLGIFFAVFWILWRKFSKNELSFWAAGIFSVVLATYFIQNLTVFDMINSYMMFFLILGFTANIAGQRNNESTIEKPISLYLAIPVFVLLIVCLLFCVIKPMEANRYVIGSLSYAPASDERLELYKKALATSEIGKYQIRDYFAESILEFAQLQDLSKVSLENLTAEFDFIIQEMKKSTIESPFDYRSFLKLGQVYNIYAVLKKDASSLYLAESILNKAIKLSPTNQQGYWAIIQTKLYLGQPQEAISLAEKSQALEPRSLQSNIVLIQVAKIIGDNALAQEKLKEAIAINPSWATSLQEVLSQ